MSSTCNGLAWLPNQWLTPCTSIRAPFFDDGAGASILASETFDETGPAKRVDFFASWINFKI